MNIDRIVGKRIEIARRERFWNQQDLADSIGVGQQAISRWESGAVSVTADNLWRLCEIFGKRIEYFLALIYLTHRVTFFAQQKTERWETLGSNLNLFIERS